MWFDRDFRKLNQIEIGQEFAHITVTYDDNPTYTPETILGVDRNSNKHVIVASNINTGKVLKLEKSCQHIHTKYKEIRRRLQKNGKYKKVIKIKNREQRILKNINHQITTKLIKEALKTKSVIVLEDLYKIRKTARTRRKQRYSLNSWSYWQQEHMLQYKAKKYGVPIFYIEPQYTSQRCSHCGHIEKANRKTKSLFHCKNCGKVENADVNAGFNIAQKHLQGISQFNTERDVLKRNTDILQKAMLQT